MQKQNESIHIPLNSDTTLQFYFLKEFQYANEYNEPTKLEIFYNIVHPTHYIPGAFLLTQSESRSSNLLQKCLKKIPNVPSYYALQENDSENNFQQKHLKRLPQTTTHIPFFGGWQYNNFTLYYSFPFNERTRQLALNTPIEFENQCLSCLIPQSVFPFDIHPKSKDHPLRPLIDDLLPFFKAIKSADKRIFLFLYLHYCYMASPFREHQSNRILCLYFQNASHSQALLSFFNKHYLCEYKESSERKTVIENCYKNTNDLPFFLNESYATTGKLLEAQTNVLLNEISKFKNEVNASTNSIPNFLNIPNQHEPNQPNLRNFAVPVILRRADADPLRKNAWKNYYHVYLDNEDILRPFPENLPFAPLFVHKYMHFIVQLFQFNLSPNCSFAKEYDNAKDALYFILPTLYKTLKSAYDKAEIDIDTELGLSGTVEDLLDRFLPTISEPRTFSSQEFIDLLIAQKERGAFLFHKRLKNENPVSDDLLSSRPCILEHEGTWAINGVAMNILCNHFQNYNISAPQICKTLLNDGFLESSNINNKTYMKRYPVYTTSETTPSKNQHLLYGILIHGPIADEPSTAPDHTVIEDSIYQKPSGKYFRLGTDTDIGKDIFWNFNKKEENRHLNITGQSGSGKSYLLNKMIGQAGTNNISTVVFHVQGKLPDVENSIVISVPNEKCGIVLTDSSPSNISTLCTILQKSLHITQSRLVSLETCLIEYFSKTQSEPQNRSIYNFVSQFPNIATELKIENRNSIFDRLTPIKRHEILSGQPIHWNEYTGKTLILDFSKYEDTPSLVKPIAELLLADLYNYQKSLDYQNDLLIVIDEYQDYDVSTNSTIQIILKKGRKNNVALWLASQLPPKDPQFKELVRQSGIQMYFSSDLNRNKSLACMLTDDMKLRSEYKKKLNAFKPGDYLLSRQGFLPVFARYTE